MTKEDFDEIEELISAAGHAVCFAKKHNREGSPREQIEAELAQARAIIRDAYNYIRDCQDRGSDGYAVRLPWEHIGRGLNATDIKFHQCAIDVDVTAKNEDSNGKINK